MSQRQMPVSSYAKGFLLLLVIALVFGYIGRPPQRVQTVGQNGTRSGTEGTDDLDIEGEALTPEEAQEAAAAAATGKSSSKKATSKAAAASGLVCASGKNGGRTDIGVSGSTIRLATTAALDGHAASLLQNSPTAMKAVINKINGAGGICGRRISLQVVNDAFRADLGHQYLLNFMEEKDPKKDIFAFPVVPSAEGLSSAIQAGDIQKFGMPVVGTDGLRIEQYDAKAKAATVWPVAAATVSTMRIIAKYAYQVEEARTFAIIWDRKYKFGVEGRDAFRAQVEALGGRIQADVPLDPDVSSYATEVAEFNGPNQCGSSACNAVVMLLLPDTARNWLSREPVMGQVYSAGAQTLFTDTFADDCASAIGARCHGFAVWTGYNPPIGQYAALPGVAAYIDDLALSKIDVRNQFTEGAYFGMSLFVEALKKVGPNLTREGLKKTLDALDYNTDLASNLSWRPGKHNANVRARSFSVVISNGDFTDWADEGTGWRLDPAFGG